MKFKEILRGIKEKSKAKSGDFPRLFKQISPENFNKLIDHAIANYATYQDKDYHYFEKSPLGADTNDPHFLACSYEIYRQPNGELALIIQVKSKLSELEINRRGNLTWREKGNVTKPKGADKKGSTSFCIDGRGLTKSFTLVAHGEDSIARVKEEQKILSKIHSPFIVKLLFGEVRYKYKKDKEGKEQKLPRLSISTAKAVCDGTEIKEFASLTDFLVGVKSLALGVQAISKAGYIHQDLKRANILLMPKGIIKITDFGLAIPEDNKNSDYIGGTVGSQAPEVLASIVAEQREQLLKNGKLNETQKKTLTESVKLSLTEQIYSINTIGNEIKAKATARYAYNFYSSDAMSFNDKAIQIWDRWQAKNSDLLKEIKLPSPQQDMWSLGSMLLELLNKVPCSSPNQPEGKFLSTLKLLIRDKIVNAPPADRMTIDAFIAAFDQLLKDNQTAIPALTEVNRRIQQHIQKFSKAEKTQSESKVELTAQAPASPDSVPTTVGKTSSLEVPERKAPASPTRLPEPSQSKPSESSTPAKLKQALPSAVEKFLDYYDGIHAKCANSNGLTKAFMSHSIFAENRFAKRELVEKIGRIVVKYGHDIYTKKAQAEIDDLIKSHIKTVGNNNLGRVLCGLSDNYEKYCTQQKPGESFSQYLQQKELIQAIRNIIDNDARAPKEVQDTIDNLIIHHIEKVGDNLDKDVLCRLSTHYRKYCQQSTSESFSNYVMNLGSTFRPDF